MVRDAKMLAPSATEEIKLNLQGLQLAANVLNLVGEHHDGFVVQGTWTIVFTIDEGNGGIRARQGRQSHGSASGEFPRA